MGKRLIIGMILILAVVIIAAAYIFSKPISSSGPRIKLTDDKIIIDSQLIDSITNKMVSPNGNNLTKFIQDPDDPNIMDDSWRFEYYVCDANEHSGWVYKYSGGNKAKPLLYGPFGWCLI